MYVLDENMADSLGRRAARFTETNTKLLVEKLRAAQGAPLERTEAECRIVAYVLADAVIPELPIAEDMKTTARQRLGADWGAKSRKALRRLPAAEVDQRLADYAEGVRRAARASQEKGLNYVELFGMEIAQVLAGYLMGGAAPADPELALSLSLTRHSMLRALCAAVQSGML